jgi:hypothetical protein
MLQQGHSHGQGQRQGGQGQGSQQGQNQHDISTSTSSNSPSSLSPPNDRLLRATRSSPIVLQGGVANTSQSSTPYSPSQASPPFASAAAPPVPQVMLTVSRRMSQSFSSVPSADLSSARSLTPNSHRSMPMVTSNSATQLMTTQSPQHNQHMLPSLSAPNLSPGAAASASAGSARRPQQQPFFPESHEEGNEEEEEHSDDDNDSDSDDSAKGKRKGTGKESKGKGKGMGAGEEEENGMKAYKTTHNTSNISHQSHHPQRAPSAAAVSAASTPRDEEQDHDSMSSTSFGSSSVTTQLEEEWLELRHKCEPSWGTSADPSGAIFWTNYDQNPTLVEAAIGFIDAFPEIFLVPPLSPDLASRCERCERVLEEEVLNQINRIEVKEIATQRREELESYLEELQKRQDDLYDLPLNIATAEDRERERREEEEKMYERQLNEQMALKLRQERARLRDICHPGEVITSASAVATVSGAIAPVTLSARPVIHGKGYAEEDHEDEAAATAAIASGHFNIFLTSAPSPSHGEAGPEAHPEVDPHISRPVPMKINSKALEKLITTRITQQSSRLMRIGDALVLIKDRSCAPKLIHITNTATPAPTNTDTTPSSHTATTRRPPHSKKITSLQATILVQSLIRGALIRWRLRRKQRALKKMNSLFLIQKYARRFVAKLRLNQRRREFRYECLILRKAINRRHKAAVILQNFMKYAVFLVRREDYLRKYNSLCYFKLPTQQQQQQQTGHTQQQQQRQTQQQQTAQGKYARYLQSAVTIQKIFRGYKQRNDFMKWSQAIRLLANTSHSRHTLRSKLKYNFHQMMAGTGTGTGTGGEEGARGRGGTSSHRTLHYTVAGSGGFQFKFRKKEVNLMRLPSSTSSVGMGGTSFQEEQGQGQGQCQEDGDKKERKHQHSSSSSTSSPSLLNLILKESDHFQTLLVRENAGIEMIHVQEEEGAGAGQGKGNEETTGAGGIGGGAGAGGRDPHGRRVSSGIPMPMPLIPQFSEEKPSARRSCDDDDISLGTTPSSSARQRDLEETQRSSAIPELETIPATPGTAGTGTETGTGPERPRSKKIRRALSRQNTFGTSVINTKTLKKLVSNGERSFVPDTNSPAAVSAAVMAASSSSPSLPDPNGSRRRRSSAAAGAAGGLGGSGSAIAVGSVIKLKSTNDAYVNPSVHQRSVFRRQRDPGQASLQENSNNIKHLLQSLYE